VADLKTTYTNLPLLNTAPLSAVSIANISTYDFTPYVDGKIVPTQPSQQGVRVPSIFGSSKLAAPRLYRDHADYK
jgi:hypothetical protein